jgi:hypothetical protein
MKPFLPFLLIPVVAMAGWGLADYIAPEGGSYVPKIAAVEAPPSLGQSSVTPPTDGPIRVRMTALLPPPTVPGRLEEPKTQQAFPTVAAILVHGSRRVAQIDGIPMVIGESRGVYRIAAIEPDRVLFVQTVLGGKRWVPVADR